MQQCSAASLTHAILQHCPALLAQTPQTAAKSLVTMSSSTGSAQARSAVVKDQLLAGSLVACRKHKVIMLAKQLLSVPLVQPA
jgi:hypothetical protein